MNLVRIGIALTVIGAVILLVTNAFLPRVYNIMLSTLSNVTISLDVYSRYLVPVYVNNPAYIVVMLNNSYPLSVYIFDSFGHVLTPLSYSHEHGLYLITFPLLKHGNYSLVLFNNNPEPLNVSLSVTAVSQYIVGNALLINLVMDLGVVIFILGVLLIVMRTLYTVKYRFLNTR
ncbi:MAG: hypothetical protein ACP5GZ_02705 [Vulcanisaeta sp.]|uniref:hypothetical protein n=1 Tax=Vulcanisaeta sp. TaxID=2020871 RepID=UPI003D0B532C